MAITAAIAGTILAASTVENIHQQKEAAKDVNRQNKLEQRKADIAAARGRAETLRQSKVARAQVVAGGEAAGVGGSTGVAGGVASIGTQTASVLGFANQNQQINQAITSSRIHEASALSKANTASAIGGLASSVFSVAQGRA